MLLHMLTACSNELKYQKQIPFSQQGMSINDTLDFDFVIDNPKETFNLILNLEYLKTYPYQNIFFFVDVLGPQDLHHRDTIECILANPSGQWLGEVSGDMVHQDLMYRYYTHFPTKGEYKIRVQHAMRDTVLPAMRAFGIELRKFKKE